ncbi:MAG: DUF5777 family beta-barrel protein [Candidatus Neomarinimicrobiota bacterium]
MKKIIFMLSIHLCCLYGQDDLLEMIMEEKEFSSPVQATFKATRIVNAQSIEMPRVKTLEFMILHRFGSMSDYFYDFFGMDEAVIRFDLKYGLNNRFSFGLGRSSLNKTYDFFTKLKLLNQKNGQKSIPVSICIFSKIEIQAINRELDMIDRITFDLQALIARKFNRSFSFQIMPTLIHRNLVQTEDTSHDLISLGVGGRIKITNRTSLNFDTFFPLGHRPDQFKQGWGLGCDIETGGHVFQLMITNAQGSYESEYVEHATGQFEDLNLYLGFNISRVFTL